jgi:hypothetical protein
MIRNLFVALLLLVGAAANLTAQQQHSGDDDPGPITTLLSLQSEIGLSAAQAAELARIEVQMDEQNQPLVTQLVEIRRRIRALGSRRDMSAENRALFESFMAEARPLMRQIRENNESAMEQVGAVLTEVQKDTLRALLRERDDNSDRSDRNSRFKDRGH